MMDPAAVRIVFVRNPYVALLSAFLDVAGIDDATQANKHHISSRPGAIGRHLGVMGYNSTAQHFQRFLMDLIHLRATKQKVPGPMFVPQSSMCRIGQGMQYELALMVEAIDLWYPDLVNLLGLEEAARSGWCSNASQTANNALVRYMIGLMPSEMQYYVILLYNREYVGLLGSMMMTVASITHLMWCAALPDYSHHQAGRWQSPMLLPPPPGHVVR